MNIRDDYYLWAEQNPMLRGALSLAPGVGQAMAVWDYQRALERGDQAEGALAAASIIPGMGFLKAGRSALIPTANMVNLPALRSMRSAVDVNRAFTTGADIGQGASAQMQMPAALPPPNLGDFPRSRLAFR